MVISKDFCFFTIDTFMQELEYCIKINVLSILKSEIESPIDINGYKAQVQISTHNFKIYIIFDMYSCAKLVPILLKIRIKSDVSRHCNMLPTQQW